MSRIDVGDAAPDIVLSTQDGEQLRLGDFSGKNAVVLFFYPRDGSPVCTKEACAFRDAYEDFVEAGAVVIGVSGDSATQHQAFASNYRLPFTLVSDSDGKVRQAFGVPKSMGLLPGRVTYVIDSEGIVRHVFSSQFAADRHVKEALGVIRQLNPK
jgi:peroxiredoxin Q/BCP